MAAGAFDPADFLPFIDVSYAQGTIDFGVMRSRGVLRS